MSDFGCRCTDNCPYRQQCETEVHGCLCPDDCPYRRQCETEEDALLAIPNPARVAILNRRIKHQRKQLRALNRALREWQDAARIARLETIDRNNRLVNLRAVVRQLSGRLNKALINLAICEGKGRDGATL